LINGHYTRRGTANNLFPLEKPQSVIILVCLFFLFSVRPASAADDALTKLPLYPGVASVQPVPPVTVCGSEMQGDFYIVMGDKVDEVNEWYARHLTGFHMYHAFSGGRTQDSFFSVDGTKEITVTSSRSDRGQVFSISYGKFRPGLSEAAMASFNQPKRSCD
jgi:hypothetical protein